ncbi:MAG: hypothetical protein ACXVCK_21195 [Bdellovibrionota bacterium]
MFSLLLWLAAPLISGAATPKPPPVLLATITLSPHALNYKVDIPSCATFGDRLIRLKLREISGRASFDRLFLTYADGQTQSIKIGAVFQSGGESPWMDLGVHGFSDSRCVSQLSIVAQALTPADPRQPRRTARVEVFGQSEISSR